MKLRTEFKLRQLLPGYLNAVAARTPAERGVYAASRFVRPEADRITTAVRGGKRPEGRAPGAVHRRSQLVRAGFTLAEVLAALAFMAIVIPVAVRGLQIANRAGVVAQRKAIAARIGERVLNEIVVSQQWNNANRSGTTAAGPYQFHWTLHSQAWNQISANQTVTTILGVNQSVVTPGNIHELSVDVDFPVQGQNYSVHLSTLIDTTQQATGTIMPQL